MRNDPDREAALSCLRLAHNPDNDPAHCVERAGAYYAFVTGETSREAIDAALDRAGVK